MNNGIVAGAFCIFLWACTSAFAFQESLITPQEIQQRSFPFIKKTGPNVFRLGNIQIHQKACSLTFSAVFAENEGRIRSLVSCSNTSSGQSLLQTPYDAHAFSMAFLLLGTDVMSKGEINADITVIYHLGEKRIKASAGDLIEGDGIGQITDSPVSWRYHGPHSCGHNENEPGNSPIIGLKEAGSGGADHCVLLSGNKDHVQYWSIKTHTVPAAGTPATVIIKLLNEN